MTTRDHIHYLAVDLLDVAVRTGFTQVGIDAFEAKVREAIAQAVPVAPIAAVEPVAAPAPVKAAPKARKPKTAA